MGRRRCVTVVKKRDTQHLETGSGVQTRFHNSRGGKLAGGGVSIIGGMGDWGDVVWGVESELLAQASA